MANPEAPQWALLPYQRHAIEVIKDSEVTLWEKGRRCGATWGVGSFATVLSSRKRTDGGMNTFYIGYNRDMTREFIDTCAEWAQSFAPAAASVDEFLFDDGSEKGIQAFRIKFASGFEIKALCSRPRSLRGMQGFVIIDEAAFHDDLAELVKAAMALLIWGGKVLILSTHNGVDNHFNELIEDARAGRVPYAVLRTTFDEAVEQGLYKRVCMRTGEQWSPEAEQKWVEGIRKRYRDDAEEELDVIPRKSGGRYISRVLLEARTTDAPVLRWQVDDEFVDKGEEQRFRECQVWCEETLLPVLKDVTASRCVLGEDFGRDADLTVLWPLAVAANLHRHTPFVVELRNVPFRQQEQILFYICDRLPKFSGGAFDARGNGQYLAEVARQRYGAERIKEVMLSEGWYRDNMPKAKAALEDGTMDLPKDSEIVDDFRSIEVIKGVPRVPDKKREDKKGGKRATRHGDGAIAGVLAHFASNQCDTEPLVVSVVGQFQSNEAFGGGGSSANQDWTGFQ